MNVCLVLLLVFMEIFIFIIFTANPRVVDNEDNIFGFFFRK